MKYINKGEVNLKLAKLQFGDKPIRVMANNKVAITITEGDKPRKVDYCQDWNDAALLIMREGISLIYHSKFDMWEASKGEFEVVNQSPTTAISLCYLKINGVEV